MMAVMRVRTGVFVVALTSSCSVLVDLSSLAPQVGEAGSDAMPEVSTVDAGTDGGCPAGMVLGAGFCIDATEVAAKDYATFFAAAQADAAPPWPPQCVWKTSMNAGLAGGPTYPIEAVDWCDAWAYCAWSGKRLCGGGDGGALPFAQAGFSGEWLEACSPDGSAYPYGNTYEAGRCDTHDVSSSPIPVGSPCVGGLPGLHDMAGNVSEWIDSCEPWDGGVANDICHDVGDSYFMAAPSPARCNYVDDTHRQAALDGIGIRCCANPR